ncbi:GNAT family N-acetyltransferase [Pseudoalteromonas sp. MQS005]|uniref:GNAT family N-acetyltransferase n=1 Tax=Pseudoalteromonas sp. MQS005 TaxID=1854052 RepID=UPI0007E5167C|nr:GNAT family protein [Pseudoalteromonas sp. MQS005]
MNNLTKITSNEVKDIFLQSISLDDANENYVAWLNDPLVNQYLETRFSKQDLNSVKSYISANLNNPLEQLFTIRTNNNKHIGNIKVGSINKAHNIAQVSLFIGEKESWGKGYANQAIKLINQYAFETLLIRKLVAWVYTDNIGSFKAFQKAGYSIECVLKNHYILNGKPSDLIQLSLFNIKP